MHTITDCPICGKDFMYHQTDIYLFRQITSVDEVGNNKVTNIVICQDCDEIENIAEYIKEKAVHRGWENAEYMAADKFGEDKTLEAIRWLDKNGVISQNGL